MRSTTRLIFAGRFVGIITVLVCGLSAFPIFANAQNGSQGQDAVYNSSNGVVGSSAFIDASMFASSQRTNICAVLNFVLNPLNGLITSAGAVIDARGLASSSPPTSMTCTTTNPSPWAGISSAPPSTILLPATGATAIIIPSTWALPNNTRLIGEGDGIPSTNFTPGTTIQAANSFSGSMIQFGAGAGLCLPPPSTLSVCSGISVEKLTLDGQGQSLNGITNQLAGGSKSGGPPFITINTLGGVPRPLRFLERAGVSTVTSLEEHGNLTITGCPRV